MRVLVTGSNGLLGQKLTRLFDAHHDIYLIATGIRPSVLTIGRGEYQELDITDGLAVERVFEACSPDVVIHTAAMTNVDQCELNREACWKTNVTATEYIIRACEKAKARLIYISTDFVFDGSHGPLDESEFPAPVNFYGESKLEAERVIHRSDLDWCIIRTVLVYGITRDMSRSNIVLWVKNSLKQGKTIQVVSDQQRTPTLAEDLATGCYLAMINGAKGVFHICGKDTLTPFDIARRAAQYFNLDASLIKETSSSSFKQPAKRPLITGLIIDKARRELGYEPHSFDDGMRIMDEQMKNPLLA